MKNEIMQGAAIISKFCRLNINKKKNLPLRTSHIGFLIYLLNSENHDITPMNAANFFGVTKAVITKTIAPLIESGYLYRTPSETDKRSYIISPTPKAEAVVEDANNEYYKIMNGLLVAFGTEKYRTLIRLLDESNVIIENIE